LPEADRSGTRGPLAAPRKMGRWLDRELPLLVKLAIPGLLIVGAMATWMGARLVTDARDAFRSAYRAEADHFAYMTQEQFDAVPDDQEAMVEFLGELQEYTPGLAWVRVYGAAAPPGSLWASSEQFVEEEPDKAEVEPREETPRAPHTGEILTWSFPLHEGDRTVGRILVGLDTGMLEVGVDRARSDVAVALGLGLFAGAAALGILLYWLVLRRATRISNAALRAAAGDMSVRLPEGDDPPSRDLLFNIARQFDRTLRAVDLRTRQQAAVASLGQRALAGVDVQELMEEGARLVAEGLEVEHSSVLEPAPDGFALRAGVGSAAGGSAGAWFPEDSQAGYTMRTGGPVLSEDLRTEDRFPVGALLDEFGFRSGASVVIPGPEEPYGVLAAFTLRPRTFTADDLNFLSSLATVLGAAMQRREAREQLDAAEAKYRSLVEHVPAVTYTAGFGRSGAWEYVSPQIEQMLGYTPEEWMADPRLWFTTIHPEDRDRVIAEEDLSIQAVENLSSEYRMRTKEGGWRWIRDDAVVVRDADGRPLFFQGVLYDFTDQKEAEETLRRAYDREREAVGQLRSLDEMKNAFLSAVSHELRTPLASVLGYAVTLEEQDDRLSADERREAIERLAVNARKLHRLLEDLLDLDRLGRGIVDPRRQSVDVGALARRVLEEADLGERAVDLDVARVTAELDGPKVERIVENLLMNAARHSPPSTPIRVEVRAEHGGVLIAVEDRGPGVPDDLKEDVFGPFVRGPERPTHSPGAGIGLSLVARFAELHGGRAWVEDRAGGGASFRVFLPDESPAPSSEGFRHGVRVGP
jgi:PAS domain S-box-containing protein